MTTKKFFHAPIKAYQYISRMLPASCRYYPTCSEYAKWQFEFNPPHKAMLASGLRILKCNQLFEGGIDYPIVEFTPKKTAYLCNHKPLCGKIKIIYWLAPKKGSDSPQRQGSGVAMLSRKINIHTPDSPQYYILKDIYDTHLELPS